MSAPRLFARCRAWFAVAALLCGARLYAQPTPQVPQPAPQAPQPTPQAPQPAPPGAQPTPQAPHATQGTHATTGGATGVARGTTLPCIIPLQLWNGLLTVDVVFGKGERERFVLDVGLDACTLAPSAAQQLASITSTGETRVTLYDRAETVPTHRIPHLQINLLKLENMPVGLVDLFERLSPASATRPDAPVGWLGAPFLSAYQVTLDYNAHTLILDRPDAPLPKGKGAIMVPVEVHDGRIMVRLAFPGAKPFPALFSTSAPITVIPTKVAQQARLKPLETLPITQPGGKKGKISRVTLSKLSIGKATVEGVTAVFVSPDAPPELSRDLAILGTDFLRHYKVVLSYTHHMIVFIPPPEVKPPDNPDEDKPAKPDQSHQRKH